MIRQGLGTGPAPYSALTPGERATAAANASAPFQLGILIGDVEAGLRSGRVDQDWPAEAGAADLVGKNVRTIVGRVATLVYGSGPQEFTSRFDDGMQLGGAQAT